MWIAPIVPLRPIVVATLLVALGGAVGLAHVSGGHGCGPRVKTRAMVHTVKAAAESYLADHEDVCPTIGRLVKERYLPEPPLDAWAQPLYMRCRPASALHPVDLISAGPDRMFGTDDDIGSWEPR